MEDLLLIVVPMIVLFAVIVFGLGYFIGNYILYRKVEQVKCKSCGNEGPGSKGRNPAVAGAAILLSPTSLLLWTLLYFGTTKKYRCPHCNSDQVYEIGLKAKNVRLIKIAIITGIIALGGFAMATLLFGK